MEDKDKEHIVNGTESVASNEAPPILDKEKDDVPAANNLKRTMIIAIVVLLLVYFIYELMLKK
ncbi:hypothetical protein ACFRAE_17010 [Sphingobacterium sp. HJSM2_6]|uniref:hypothetical protein n=1 Tax=Sphingobacterium sp. HJSM2_6 TaxID=3366264 RepID=UPI003BD685C3